MILFVNRNITCTFSQQKHAPKHRHRLDSNPSLTPVNRINLNYTDVKSQGVLLTFVEPDLAQDKLEII